MLSSLSEFLIFLVLLSTGISFLITPLLIKIANRFDFIDLPDERKMHKKPIPTLGGISFFISFNLVVFIAAKLNPTFNIVFSRFLPSLYLGGLIIIILGVVHDTENISARLKLAGQIAVALILFVNGHRIEYITNPLGGQVVLPILISFIMTILWVVALINTINLIDGLDGLAGGITVISASFLFFIALSSGEISTILLTAILAGSVLGFLPYNFYPAKIFMGDTGSMFLGFVLSVISMHGINKTATAVALLIPIVALGIPIYDTTVAIIRRIMGGRDVFTADRQHLHYRLLNLGITHKHVVLLLYFVSIYFGIISYLLVLIPVEFAFILLVLLTMGVFAGIKAISFIEYRTRFLVKHEKSRKMSGEEE